MLKRECIQRISAWTASSDLGLCSHISGWISSVLCPVTTVPRAEKMKQLLWSEHLFWEKPELRLWFCPACSDCQSHLGQGPSGGQGARGALWRSPERTCKSSVESWEGMTVLSLFREMEACRRRKEEGSQAPFPSMRPCIPWDGPSACDQAWASSGLLFLWHLKPSPVSGHITVEQISSSAPAPVLQGQPQCDLCPCAVWQMLELCSLREKLLWSLPFLQPDSYCLGLTAIWKAAWATLLYLRGEGYGEWAAAHFHFREYHKAHADLEGFKTGSSVGHLSLEHFLQAIAALPLMVICTVSV